MRRRESFRADKAACRSWRDTYSPAVSSAPASSARLPLTTGSGAIVASDPHVQRLMRLAQDRQGANPSPRPIIWIGLTRICWRPLTCPGCTPRRHQSRHAYPVPRSTQRLASSATSCDAPGANTPDQPRHWPHSSIGLGDMRPEHASRTWSRNNRLAWSGWLTAGSSRLPRLWKVRQFNVQIEIAWCANSAAPRDL
jgi:hypothetical protein